MSFFNNLGGRYVLIACMILSLLFITPTNSQSNQNQYYQDFSNWGGISITGDSPSSWILNSNPATYNSTKFSDTSAFLPGLVRNWQNSEKVNG